jgi:hypothetical protein
MTLRFPSIASVALAGGLIAAAPATTFAQVPPTTEQIDENIAYVIGVEAVWYGLGPVLTAVTYAGNSDIDRPTDNGQAPVNQMGHARNLYGPEDKLVVTR